MREAGLRVIVSIVLCIPASVLAQTRVIHVAVALCDNTYQGIVKVPAGIGNGQSPSTNLYWGAGYGVKTVFSRSKEWTSLGPQIQGNPKILQRLVFKHKTADVILVADAWDGRYIEACTQWLIEAGAGMHPEMIDLNGTTTGIGSKAQLLAYCGHDGLMDFEPTFKVKADGVTRDCIVFACYSKSYFQSWFKQSGVNPLVWSTGLMAPEAYLLEASFREWVKKSSAETIRTAAAQAYSTYQKCSVNAARRLLVTGY